MRLTMIDISHAQEIYTISRLNREVRFLLEGTFPPLWVEGEISNFAAPNSGHWYFSLKDEFAQVRCAMFRPQNRKLNFVAKDGMHVIAKAQISLFEGRGEFQLLVDTLEEVGSGKLQKEFEALKKRLFEAGLFDEKHKKPLPRIPKKIGVITSATGAAIRDILNVLKRRSSCTPVMIYPTLVQGESAAANIVEAIRIANERAECDVLILARGGGSLEDLWPFNEEKVALSIHQSKLPIISGVGHEIDFTIADFVADVRAPTPSAAAELIAPHCQELLETLRQQLRVLYRCSTDKIVRLQNNVQWIYKHLLNQHPKNRITTQQQTLDQAELALLRLQQQIIKNYQTQLATYAASLDALSPLATLKRGFAIAARQQDLVILRNSNDTHVGDKIELTLMQGKLDCTVDKIYN